MSDLGSGTLRQDGPTIVYIDGFNLYYGTVKETPYKWLDLEALCRRLLPRDNIVKIRYFTARVSARPNDPQQADRQDAYLRALATLPLLEIHYGRFKTRPVRLPLARPGATGQRTVEVLPSSARAGPATTRVARCKGADPKAQRLAPWHIMLEGPPKRAFAQPPEATGGIECSVHHTCGIPYDSRG
ncbi:MAG: NYN domain-containing protein [Acidimicrobiaceae bacterium]|nr:NYN domain-containing protein [Acidimicrobiaceae bacterium]MDE0498664.1 NYN domain-containing protein [Acidimicrobiaceae bacterium]